MTAFVEGIVLSNITVAKPVVVEEITSPVAVEWPIGSTDAFSRLRVSSPFTTFESKLIVDEAPLYWSELETGAVGTTSTYVPLESLVEMAVLNLTNHSRIRKTRQKMPYQSGKGGRVLMTGVVGTTPAGITKRWGLINMDDGIYFEQDSTGISCVIRMNGTAVHVPQASWNTDLLDGNGVSGSNLDTTKAQIYFLEYEWLGVGIVKFGIIQNGVISTCHIVQHINVLTAPYVKAICMPIAWEIINDGTGPASTLKSICASHESEGGHDFTGISVSADNGVTAKTATGQTLTPLLSIRLGTGQKHHGIVFPSACSVMCSSTANFRWTVLFNPTTLTKPGPLAPDWGSSITNSVIEYDTSATVVSGGLPIASGYSQQANDSNLNVFIEGKKWLGMAADDTHDIVTLAVQRVSAAGSDTFYGSLTWKESL